jgi:hypothetical protein
LDGFNKVLVALTASGSAISSWAVWAKSIGQVAWVILASVAAVLAIVHSALGVAHRLKTWGDVKRSFTGLKISLETLQYKMRFDMATPVATFGDEFIKYRQRYLKAVQALPNDVFVGKRLTIKVQTDLNKKIEEDQSKGA